MSRLIRSPYTQQVDHETKQIQIRDLYIPSLAEELDVEPESELTLEDIAAEREAMLASTRMLIEQERNALEHDRFAFFQEIENARVQWEEEKIILQQQAYDEGFSQGFEDGTNKAYEQMHQTLAMANQVVLDAKENAQKYISDQEYVILDLAITAAENILNTSLERNEEAFISIVRRGLKEAIEMKEIKIFVAPQYYSVLTKNRDELVEMFPIDVPVMIFVNEDFQNSESYIETNHGRIVVSIDEQLNELRKKLTELLDSGE